MRVYSTAEIERIGWAIQAQRDKPRNDSSIELAIAAIMEIQKIDADMPDTVTPQTASVRDEV